jgi:hypothetical protein
VTERVAGDSPILVEDFRQLLPKILRISPVPFVVAVEPAAWVS